MKIQQTAHSVFFDKVITLLNGARKSIVKNINQTMVYTYFEIGRMIVEREQGGKSRAEYGGKIIQELSERLTKEFGKGFSLTNVKQMRQFYLVYSKTQTLPAESNPKSQTLSNLSQNPNFQLSWSHYLKLVRIET